MNKDSREREKTVAGLKEFHEELAEHKKKERIKYIMEWKKNNKDKVRESNRRYRETHKEEILSKITEEDRIKKREYMREWKKNNKDKVKEQAKRRYMRRKEEQNK